MIERSSVLEKYLNISNNYLCKKCLACSNIEAFMLLNLNDMLKVVDKF